MDVETGIAPGDPSADARGTRRRRMAIVGAAAAVVVGAVAIVVLRARGEPPLGSEAAPADAALPGALTAPAPWPPNGEALAERLERLGLPTLAGEGEALHIHVVLEILIDGRPVPIPGGIGIDPEGRFLAPIHTHDASGTVHVESDLVRAFRLGEIFDVWGIPIDARCLGPYCAGGGATLVYAMDGEPVAGDPREAELADGQVLRVEFSAG